VLWWLAHEASVPNKPNKIRLHKRAFSHSGHAKNGARAIQAAQGQESKTVKEHPFLRPLCSCPIFCVAQMRKKTRFGSTSTGTLAMQVMWWWTEVMLY